MVNIIKIKDGNCLEFIVKGEMLILRNLQEVLTLIDELKKNAILAWPEDWELHVAGLNDD